MILYITGSFPRLGDGIGDAAGKLFSSMKEQEDIRLVTTAIPSIESYVEEMKHENVMLVPNWRFKTICNLLKYIKEQSISQILIEYCGNGYKKDLAISFMPLMIRWQNLFSKNKIECHLRLHEYTMCRPARKIFTWPLVRFCHHLDTPSFVEYEHLKKKFGKKVFKSGIGSNINWTDNKKPLRKITENGENAKINLAFFGGIYPGKGIEKLIELWSRIEQEYPDKYQYYLLGGFPKNLTNAFDDYQISIQKLIAEKNLTEKIIITGFLPESEIEEKLDMIDIAVLPYEDGLTLRRGSFLAFLGRNVAVVTSSGDEEARQLFEDAMGVKMCSDQDAMIREVLEYSKDNKYYEAGLDNAKYRSNFEWDKIAVKVLECFKKDAE